MTMMLSVFSDFVDTLVIRLSTPTIFVALWFAIVGLSFSIMANRFSRAIRQTNNLPENDGISLAFKVVGIVLLVLSVVIMYLR